MKGDRCSSTGTVNPNREMRNNKKRIMSKEESNKCEKDFIFILTQVQKEGIKLDADTTMKVIFDHFPLLLKKKLHFKRLQHLTS